MRKTISLALVAALLATGACARRDKAVTTTPPPVAQTPTTNEEDVGLVELPGSQADLIAKAGSDTIYFGTDKSDVDGPSRTTLTAQAKWLLANPSVRASIEGHADERGTREYNMALGERRANAARDYLVAQGVPATRLLVTSWGKEKPVATGADESAWAQNRREVTVVVK
ncbi:peptidoglycan-associated lipoprotein Pal [Sphingomonas sp.]|uniref:peptidoglycan-associated lipoprotein Pal n=1 Tax=Sphingomonas sp. TaxID=28214 RepID=UPI003750B9C4